MCAAVFQYQQDLVVCNTPIEVPHPLQEDGLCHPGLLVVLILIATVLEFDMAETASSGELANNPQGHFVGASPLQQTATVSFPRAAALQVNCNPLKQKGCIS